MPTPGASLAGAWHEPPAQASCLMRWNRLCTTGPWRRDSTETASGEPRAVQSVRLLAPERPQSGGALMSKQSRRNEQLRGDPAPLNDDVKNLSHIWAVLPLWLVWRCETTYE